MYQQTIQTTKGYPIAACIYEGGLDSILIIASATGVKQSFYRKFATFMSHKGITVVTFDYCGIGSSLMGPIKYVGANAADWGSNDLEAVIQWVKHHYPAANLIGLGHSIGGQLIGLAPSAYLLKRVVLVAAQTGYWKFWPGIQKVRMWANWYLLFPTLIRLFGYMPSKKISGMENLPKQVALQWSRWCRNKDYLFGDLLPEQQYFQEVSAPMVVISIDRDPFAPRQAVDWLSAKYHSKVIKGVHLMPRTFGVRTIGHFGIFKEKFHSTIWELLHQSCVR